ncbi:MAG: hypothetical protein Q9224_005422, partial [Gallowayella concinna]
MDTEIHGINGGYTPEAEMSSLTMQHRPVESKRRNGDTNQSSAGSHSSEQQITILKETVIVTCQKFITHFDGCQKHHIYDLTIEEYLDFIERQRLTYMPHRGSHWDKVLKWAEFFGLQISSFATAMEKLVIESKSAAKLIWTACRALLQLGPENAHALEATFAEFYKHGLSIAFLLRRTTLLTASEHLRSEVGKFFDNLLVLVRDVSLSYRNLLGGPHETAFDFNDVFGQQISAIILCKIGIVNGMWEHTLGPQASTQIQTIRNWLQPSDRNLQKLLTEDEAAVSRREEFTCEWFQSHLLAFSRSHDKVLSLQGSAGCGKSVLAGWIVERLQRPLGKKGYDTISCKIESDVALEDPSTVARRLLLQLLEKNVGNKTFFRSLVEAHQATSSKDSKSAERSLWRCIDTALDQYRGNDYLMIVIDGLDELEGGQHPTTEVANHITSLASKYSNVQAIMCSRGSVAKSGQGKTRNFVITSDRNHDDLRLVIDKSLGGCKHFDHQDEHARENIVEHLLHAAKGSFLWAILTAFILKRESSHDGFNKVLKTLSESSEADVGDLIVRLTSTIDLSRPDIHLPLSWMLVTNRPLTFTEMQLLLKVDLAKKISMERETNTISEILATLRPFVSRANGFVRFRHSIIRQYMLSLQQDGKKLKNRRDAQADITMRLLAYCRLHLAKSYDPTFEMLNQSEADDLFAKYGLLEYATVHWLDHFRRSTFQQDNGSLQLTSDFKAVFPGSTRLALLEWSCWGTAGTNHETIQSYKDALRIRQEALTQHHRAVLQGLIVCGSGHRDKHQITEAGSCFYRASRISQHLLRKYDIFT